MPELSDIDLLWMLIAFILVFNMQAGFAALESGLTRNKNAVSAAMKSLTGCTISMLLFWLCSYGLMVGTSWHGWIGTAPIPLNAIDGTNNHLLALFQGIICATAVAISSGSVAERMRFGAFLVMAVLVSGLLYPVLGHWAWHNNGAGDQGWLAALGFIDFAGATVVHSVGGWVALAAIIVLGARRGRFNAHGRPVAIPGSSLPLAVLGCILLWIGWFGFIGGHIWLFNETIINIAINTLLAGISGSFTAIALGLAKHQSLHPKRTLNGCLAGLVAITATANRLTPEQAMLLGSSGALAMLATRSLLLMLKLDDAVNAIPVHLGAGILGTLSVAFVAVPPIGHSLFYLLGIQIIGIIACGGLAFGITWLALTLLHRSIYAIRIDHEGEIIGLDVADHNTPSALHNLIVDLEIQKHHSNYQRRVHEEPATEEGMVARQCNQLIAQLEQVSHISQTVLDGISEGVVLLDKQSGNIVQTNQAVLSQLQYQAGALEGRSLSTLIGGDQRLPSEIVLKMFFMASDTTQDRQITLFKADGEQITAKLRFSLINNASGQTMILMVLDFQL